MLVTAGCGNIREFYDFDLSHTAVGLIRSVVSTYKQFKDLNTDGSFVCQAVLLFIMQNSYLIYYIRYLIYYIRYLIY